ncbi:MAG: septum formation initiator family protein [Endomicrobiales bacterium]|nr:septum formation initiator family protein [Endomicrobiales bacterium]
MKIPKHALYIILGIALVLFLFGNAGFRKLVRRHWEMYKLKAEFEHLQRESGILEKEIYLLENDESYIERIARKELGLIAPGEVEYRFKKKE